MKPDDFFTALLEDGMAGGTTAGGGAIAGIGVASPDPNAPKNFAEPGVPPKQKKKVIVNPKAPLSRKALSGLMGFKEWVEESKHDVRDVSGSMTRIAKKPVRKPSGKVEMEYPGKSSSSGGGD
jgi:hypothetical protein